MLDLYLQQIQNWAQHHTSGDALRPPEIWHDPWLETAFEYQEQSAKKFCYEDEHIAFDDYADRMFLGELGISSDGNHLYHEIMIALSELRFSPGSSLGRSPFQITLHEYILEACLPFIYGKEWHTDKASVLRKHNIKKIRQFVLASTPRRYGKTQAIAMAIAVLVALIPGFKIVLFGQNQRTTQELLAYAIYYMGQIAPSRGRIVLKQMSGNSNVVIWSSVGTKDSPLNSKIVALPSGSDNLRGQGYHLGIVEEAVFVPEETFTVGMAPGLGKVDSAMVAISSASPDVNHPFNTWLYEKDDTGEFVFHSLIVELLCKKCREEKKNAWKECTHMSDEKPHWLDPNRAAVLKCIYKLSPELYASEIQGVSSNMYPRCLDSELVGKALEKRTVINYHVPIIGVFIDPSGGGRASNMGIVSGYYTTKNDFVVSGVK